MKFTAAIFAAALASTVSAAPKARRGDYGSDLSLTQKLFLADT